MIKMKISRTIMVSNNTAHIDTPIYLYKGDGNVLISLDIINITISTKLNQMTTTNYINDNISYATACLCKRDSSSTVHIVGTKVNDKIELELKKEMMDETVEVGEYMMQVHLFDKENNRLTIPVVEEINIMLPLCSDGYVPPIVYSSKIGEATVDYSKVVAENMSVSSDFYHTYNWTTGEYITANKLNNMITGIDEALYDIKNIQNNYATKSELSNKANKNEIPTKISQLLNDKGYLTEHQDLSNYATKSYVNSEIANAQLEGGGVDLSDYATKDELNEKANINDVPTKLSDLQNDTNFITSIPSEYITETELNNKNFASKTYVSSEIAKAQLEGGDGTGISSITDAELDAVLISVFGESCVPQIYGEIIASVTNLSINEGGNKTFTVALSQAPSYDQVIEVKSNNTNVTVSPNTLIFNADNYNVAQIVTVNVSLDGLFTNYDANVLLENDRAINKNITVNIVNTEELKEIPCTSLQLSQTSLNLKIDDVVNIIASPIPSNTTDTVLWSASNGNCKVENGVVTAISSGDCIVTATCGNQSATCSINIVEPVVVSELYYDFSAVSNSITVEDTVGDNDAILGANRSADADGAVDLTGTYLESSNNITLDGDFEIDTILSCDNGNTYLFAIGDVSNTTAKCVALRNTYGTLQAQITDATAQKYNHISSTSGTSYTTEYFHVVMSKVGNTFTFTVNDVVQGSVNVTADIFPLSSKIYIAKELRDGTEKVISRKIKIKSFKITQGGYRS